MELARSRISTTDAMDRLWTPVSAHHGLGIAHVEIKLKVRGEAPSGKLLRDGRCNEQAARGWKLAPFFPLDSVH